MKNLRKIRKQIIDKVEEIESAKKQISEHDQEYIHYVHSILTQPSPETVLQLKLYKRELTARLQQVQVDEITIILFIFKDMYSVVVYLEK